MSSIIRKAEHYTDYTGTPSGWFIVDIARIYGKRDLYSDLQDYISSHKYPKLFLPDARIITQDVALQISTFLNRESSLSILILYDRPEDISEILRYYIEINIKHKHIQHNIVKNNKHMLLNNLVSLGFISKDRSHFYFSN